MKIHRTIPPAAAPLKAADIIHGLGGFLNPRKYRNNLEQELRDYFQVKHVFPVSSGKAALTIILLALKALSPKKRQVLMPAYTCFSVPSAVVRSGLEVALCDMDVDTYDYNHHLLQHAVGPDTLCVISGNLFGIPSDIDRIVDVCRDKGIYVVEDAAQAMGCKNEKNRFIGTIADVGFYSLGRGKNITCGSGGIIITNSDVIASSVNTLYNQLTEPRFLENIQEFLKAILLGLFIRPSLYWFPAGLPFLKLGETFFYRDFPVERLSGMKAGMLKNWRRRLEEYNRKRKENTDFYRGVLQLESRSGLKSATALLRLPMMADNREMRDTIIASSYKKGLGISRMYPTPINCIEEIRNNFSGQEYPTARMLSECLFTVPIHPLLKERDRRTICELLGQLTGSTKYPCGKDQRLAVGASKTR
jgi:perosamine synthetase